METQEFRKKAADGLELFCRSYEAEEPHAALMVIHGMAEHSKRYEDFARFMAQAGISVLTFDLRGHGKTAKSLGNLGHFSNRQGWQLVLHDVRLMLQYLQEQYATLPRFLLGHSMGSLLSRSLLKEPLNAVQGVILSGTTHDPGFLTKAGIAIAKTGGTLFGYKKQSKLHDRLTFGRFNKPFDDGSSSFNWLTRDTERVKQYEDDLYCGFVCTLGFYRDMLQGLKQLYETPDAEANKKLPLWLIAGDQDPVSNFGTDIQNVFRWYEKSGFQALDYQLYPGARHELLNETNRQEVYQDILQWIRKQAGISE